jgi:hypothetical protein
MKYLLLLALLFPVALTATSYMQPEPIPIQVGKYALFTNEELEREILKNPGSTVALEIKKDKDGSLICDLGDEGVSRITQFADHFIIEVSQMNARYHCITTYMGTLRSAKNPVLYRGTYVRILHFRRDNGWNIATEKGVFTIIGKLEDERK